MNTVPEETTNFKKGRALPVVIGLVVVGAAAGGIYLLAKKTAEKQLDPGQRAEQVRKILVEPTKDQLADWRKIVDDKDSDEGLRQEAIFQLARLQDQESAGRFVKLLGSTSDKATTRVLSMAILELPRDAVKDAKGPLEKKFDDADSSDLPQVTAALTYLQDKDYFQKILNVYKCGNAKCSEPLNPSLLTSAHRVDNSAAFDPLDLANLTDRATFRGLSKDSAVGVRLLVATYLSTTDTTKDDLGTLTDLLKDSDIEVSAASSVGIAKLNDPTSSQILVQKLAEAQTKDDENASKKYMEALKNGLGGEGLVYALEVVPQGTPNSEERGRLVLSMVRDLADPKAAAAYKKYIGDEKNPPHYRSQIALALADIGDPDALPFLAARMDAKGIGFKCEGVPSTEMPKCLSKNLGWKKQPPYDADPVTFREQQFAAQDIGDLALLYPEKKQAFHDVAADHLRTFNSWFPQPILVASRALAYLDDKDEIDFDKQIVKSFKLPPTDLVDLGMDKSCDKNPTIGCRISELNFFTTGARFVGYSHDKSFADSLSKMLTLPKDKKGNEIGTSQEILANVSNPGFRQAVMAAANAAADGLSEWGQEAAQASDDLVKAIKANNQNEFVRYSAGRALGMVGSPQDILKLLGDLKPGTDGEAKCAAMMAGQRKPTPEVAAAAFEYIQPSQEPEQNAVNVWAARVVGWAGTKGLEDKLIAMLDNKDVRPYAVLAIVLGGDDDLVRRGMALFEQKARGEKPDDRFDMEVRIVRKIYLDTFDGRGVTREDVDTGRLFRFVHNAMTMKRLGASSDQNDAGQTPHTWAALDLMEGLKRLDMNATVPGGVDKLMIRALLNKSAKAGDDATKAGAVEALFFFKEQGSLMALRDEAGLTGDLARRAYFELRNPGTQAGAPESAEKKDKGLMDNNSTPKK